MKEYGKQLCHSTYGRNITLPGFIILWSTKWVQRNAAILLSVELASVSSIIGIGHIKFCITSNNQRLQKCVRCVFCCFITAICVFWADPLLRTLS